jgi:hypothetical protein
VWLIVGSSFDQMGIAVISLVLGAALYAIVVRIRAAAA